MVTASTPSKERDNLWFSELSLHSFGRFSEKNFQFKPGFNLIIGENESGKTTLLQAIFGTLFGLRGETHIPWHDPTSCRAALRMLAGSREILIERNFLEDKVALIEIKSSDPRDTFRFHGRVAPGGRAAEREVYLQKLEDFFGFSDAALFRHTLILTRQTLESATQQELFEKIKHLLSGFNQWRPETVLKNLEEKYFLLTKKNPEGVDKKNNRVLETLQEDIRLLTEELEKTETSYQKIFSLNQQDEQLRQEENHGVENLRMGEKKVEILTRLHQISQEEYHANQRFTEIKAQLEKRQLLEKEREKSALPPVPLVPLIPFLLLPLGALRVPSWLWFLTGCAVVGITGILWRFFSQRNRVKFLRFKYESQLEILPALSSLHQSFEEKKKQLDEIQLTRRDLFSKNPFLSELQSSQYFEEIIHTNEQIDMLSEPREQLLDQRRELANQRELLMANTRNPSLIQEDLSLLHEQAEQLQRRAQALWTGKKLFNEAVETFEQSYRHQILSRVEEYLNVVTRGDHPHIQWEGETIKIMAGANFYPLEHFSEGTCYQFFLAVKTALIDLLAQRHHLPILFDDPLTSFDPERKLAALQTLLRLSEKHQVLFLSHDPWYKEILKSESLSVLELPR